MHIWTEDKWIKNLDIQNKSYRSGLRLVFDKQVDGEVKRAFKEFAVWLRQNYYFPIRVPAYIKASPRIKAMDGEYVCGTFFRPSSYSTEPYIRVAVGDYHDLLAKRGKDNALASLLWTFAHELTHYYQWINDLKLTLIGEERQASRYARLIMDEYAQTRDHP